MKNLKYFFLIFVSLLIIQCSDEIPTKPIDLALGKVSLKIDKKNAPSNVVLVEAYLVSEEQDTLYGALNIISSTSADILFDDVTVGDWYLKVDAKDDEGIILYTGETEISVQAGILTQVNLTLVPTGNGTGSIYLYVNWGTSSNWNDYDYNPVFTIDDSYNNPIGVVQAKIIKENNIFKMWYNNLYNSAVSDIRYAESMNGIQWTSNNMPVLDKGEYGTWDSYGVQVGAIIKDSSNNYLMYYTGMQNPNDYWHIGLAFSNDGENWTKQSMPVLQANFNEPQIHVDCVIEVNNFYFMYYSILSGSFRSIGMATSSDGINWERNPSNPILSSTQNWEGSQGIYFPSVIYEDNTFKMIYMNQLGNAFGIATSPDGYNWNKRNSNPFFTSEQTNDNWAYKITYPYIMKIDNEYRVYYSGNNSNYNYNIGFIRKFGTL